MSQYLDTATELAQKVAGEALDYFTADTREDGSTFYTVANEGTPDWVRDLVYAAHGDFMPEDWRYEKIMHALGAIQDTSEDTDLSDLGHEFADGTVDVYTADRLRWLASNLNRPSYCDEYLEEFGAPMPDGGITELIGLGQYMEAREIWGYVVSALEDRCAEIETETTEDDESGI